MFVIWSLSHRYMFIMADKKAASLFAMLAAITIVGHAFSNFVLGLCLLLMDTQVSQ